MLNLGELEAGEYEFSVRANYDGKKFLKNGFSL